MERLWIVKYALTRGVECADWDGQVYIGNLVFARPSWSTHEIQLKLGKDAYSGRERAIAAAKKMQAMRVKTLQKQLDRIAALRFE